MTLSKRRTTLKRVFLSLLAAAVISIALGFGVQLGLKQLGENIQIRLEDLFLFAGLSAFIIFVFTVHPANRPLRFFKNIGRLLILVLLVALVWGYAFFWVGQNAFMSPPVGVKVQAEESLKALPNAEQVTIQGAEGEQYQGWFVKNGAEKAGLILYFSGNGEESAGRAQFMAQPDSLEMMKGYHFLNVDFPGHGHSTGEVSEESFYRMARAAWDYAAARSEVNPERIVLAAWSLGTGTAIRLADEKHPAGLILFAPYFNGGELVKSFAESMFDVSIPIPLPVRNPYRSNHYAKNIQSPALLVAAKDDGIVPYAQSRRLAELFPNGQLVTLESGGHGAMWSDQASLMAVRAFLQGL